MDTYSNIHDSIRWMYFAMIRGVRIWPNTPGRAFYSKTAFHNHAALNPLFNIAYTTSRTEKFDDQFNFFPKEKCELIYAPLFPTKGNTTEHYLNTSRPNILVIVLEGFGAVFIENLGGMKDVAPNLTEYPKKEYTLPMLLQQLQNRSWNRFRPKRLFGPTNHKYYEIFPQNTHIARIT